jgi:hypothetical protein
MSQCVPRHSRIRGAHTRAEFFVTNDGLSRVHARAPAGGFLRPASWRGQRTGSATFSTFSTERPSLGYQRTVGRIGVGGVSVAGVHMRTGNGEQSQRKGRAINRQNYSGSQSWTLCSAGRLLFAVIVCCYSLMFCTRAANDGSPSLGTRPLVLSKPKHNGTVMPELQLHERRWQQFAHVTYIPF